MHTRILPDLVFASKNQVVCVVHTGDLSDTLMSTSGEADFKNLRVKKEKRNIGAWIILESIRKSTFGTLHLPNGDNLIFTRERCASA
jgi:hypothetical protein